MSVLWPKFWRTHQFLIFLTIIKNNEWPSLVSEFKKYCACLKSTVRSRHQQFQFRMKLADKLVLAGACIRFLQSAQLNPSFIRPIPQTVQHDPWYGEECRFRRSKVDIILHQDFFYIIEEFFGSCELKCLWMRTPFPNPPAERLANKLRLPRKCFMDFVWQVERLFLD